MRFERGDHVQVTGAGIRRVSADWSEGTVKRMVAQGRLVNPGRVFRAEQGKCLVRVGLYLWYWFDESELEPA